MLVKHIVYHYFCPDNLSSMHDGFFTNVLKYCCDKVI
jgi:hypothetical protein